MKTKGIDAHTSKWAKQHGIDIWKGTDDHWYACSKGDSDSIRQGRDAREAFSHVMRDKNLDPDLPPALASRRGGTARASKGPPTQRLSQTQPTNTPRREPEVAEPSAPAVQPDPVQPTPIPQKERKRSVPRGDLSGVNSEIKRVIFQHPDADTDKLMEILKERGFSSTRGSVQSIGAGFRNSMAVLRALGVLKKDD